MKQVDTQVKEYLPIQYFVHRAAHLFAPLCQSGYRLSLTSPKKAEPETSLYTNKLSLELYLKK